MCLPLQAWEMYQAKNLWELVDSVVKGEFLLEEADRFLRVGLLCVQETTKLRPAMSIASKMLTGDMDVKDVEISRPGLVADLMELKIRGKKNSHFTSSPASSSTSSFNVR